MDISLEQILAEDNIQEAIAKVESRKGVGEDGIPASKLREYWELNEAKILDTIRKGEYEPGKVIQYEQLNKRRKKRKITVFNAVDQMIARAISQVLTPVIDAKLSEACYAYRPGRSAKMVAELMAKQIEEGKQWVTEVDVSDFFDSINHRLLFDAVNNMVKDNIVVQLISSFVNCIVVTDEGEIRLARGILQGMPLSPLLSNIYLNHMDEICLLKYEGYFRYGDDIRVTSYRKEEAETILEDIKRLILENDLKINEKKSGVFQSLNRYCLGYEFQEKKGRVLITPIVHNNMTSNYRWQTTPLKKTSDHYHIVSDGKYCK